jgi:hypothetical protein
MERELAEIADDGAALLFATGCVRAILTLALTVRLHSLLAAARGIPPSLAPPTRSLPAMNSILARPRLLGLLCGAGAVMIGMTYMLAAGAPPRYLLVNLAGLALGATAWLALGRAAGSRPAGAGPMVFALAIPLLLTALFGVSVEGASRWVSLGPLSLQVSLIVLPVMLVLYARRPDEIGMAGIMVAALALAIQPDRAMSGALMAGLLALAISKQGRVPMVAAAASTLAFVWTLLKPDTSPAVPYVDGIFYTAFDVHPLAGCAVAIGAVALILPAAAGRRALGERAALWAFGGCWSGAIAAAALGNYPTPLLGYGGSAVLGYLLSVALLPHGSPETGAHRALASPPADGQSYDQAPSELRAVRLA